MATIKENSTVTLTYTGKLDNGEVFKTVTEDAPLTLKIGNQELPPTLENAIIGLNSGQSKTVRVTPEEGYGARQKLLVQKINRESLGDKIKPKPGMILSLKVLKDGEEHHVPATVMKVENDFVEIDYNHPLAGHHLTYEITILNVQN
jgi:FKBP-type peptidyl-prolyl cis-trans isomerase SlpA